MAEKAGRARVVIENLTPEIDCGRFSLKRTVGEKVVVEADVFADGHEEVHCQLVYGPLSEPGAPATGQVWTGHAPMQPLGNDRWRGEFSVREIGVFRYSVRGWIDRFQTWQHDLHKRLQAGQDVTVDLKIGGQLLENAARRARGPEAQRLQQWAKTLLADGPLDARVRLAQDEELALMMQLHPDLELAGEYHKTLTVVVDPPRARFAAWYEMFPRSCPGRKGRHGTFRDVEAFLPYIAGLGFDVLYLPPIHPVGRTFRKGKNNSTTPSPDAPGSPWGIGAAEGGHKAIHPELGTLKDFRRLVDKARGLGIDIALDIAFQCSPDHPYVKQHPEWFRHRPDGTIQYAENPPKKYQDIYPLDFETEHWSSLWNELKSVFLFWIDQGVHIFRVDNPHTKPFAFWEWVIAEVKASHPDVIFLAEAFTRPRVMFRLAKAGFTQSYTYFTWRNSREELTHYFTELNRPPLSDYFRPNLWPNTPDILTEFLQHGGRPAFLIRFLLAATLGASYGIYGPAFELAVNQPFQASSEEYLNSEKYEIKDWNLEDPASLRDLIARVNRIRRDNPALHSDHNLRFHPVDNPELICYSKHTDDLDNVILVIINLCPYHSQSGMVELPLGDFKLDPNQAFEVEDLLVETRYMWHGSRNFVALHPQTQPAHIFRFRCRVRSEKDFEYYR